MSDEAFEFHQCHCKSDPLRQVPEEKSGMLLCLLIYLLFVDIINRIKYTATNGGVVSVS